jgi:hypothetical protein
MTAPTDFNLVYAPQIYVLPSPGTRSVPRRERAWRRDSPSRNPMAM